MKYKIIYQENSVIKELKTNYIDKESLPSNIIRIKKNYFYINIKKSISNKKLKEIFYELNLMLSSNIILSEALLILIKKEKNIDVNEFLKVLQKSFSNSSNISKELDSFTIDNLIISFLKITQDTGNPKLYINALYNVISEFYEVKRSFFKTMAYPSILVVTFLLALIGIFKFVVPNFQSILLETNMNLSFATKALFLTKEFFENYLFICILLLIFIFFVFLYSYKKFNSYRFFIDKILVKKLFLFSTLYKQKELYQFFLVLDILLQSKYEFLESLIKAKVLLKNKYLLDRITKIEKLLKSGKSISFAFESINLFDDVTLSLIKTAEVSNSMKIVICEIKKIYKKRFDDKLKFFSLFIEPLFFIIIMVLIVWIILAIFVPLWSMSDMLRV